MLQPAAQDYALGLVVDGHGASRYFWHPGANAGFLSVFFAYEQGDGVVLMTNKDYSKDLMLETIRALAKQYGWAEFPSDESRFSNPWVIGLSGACIILLAYSLFRIIRHHKNRNEQPLPSRV
jgi:hypothetical protein